MGDFTNLTEEARAAIRGTEITLTATYVVEDHRFGRKKEFTDRELAEKYRACLISGHNWERVKRQSSATQDELFECTRCKEWMYD